MSDRPGERPEERRRTGPLGDDAAETRRAPSGGEPTREVPGGSGGQSDDRSLETQRIPQRPPDEAKDKESRVIRASGTTREEATPYPRGYFEAAEEREDRLRDMYGGVDWLASFLGFIFVLVTGAVFSLIGGLVLTPLGLSLDLGAEIGAAAITGFVLVGVLVFLMYFFGGYVAGRLARFDGGRNGAMLLLWSFVAVALLVLAGGVFGRFLPTGISEDIQNNVLAIIGSLTQLGVVGVAVAVGALLLALLGGFLGGRLGRRYHAQIDRTT